jgi:hypothetical protein
MDSRTACPRLSNVTATISVHTVPRLTACCDRSAAACQFVLRWHISTACRTVLYPVGYSVSETRARPAAYAARAAHSRAGHPRATPVPVETMSRRRWQCRFPTISAGQWENAARDDCFETHDPYAGKAWALIPRCGEADVARAVSFMSPFGGYRHGGVGRESGKEAIYDSSHNGGPT